MTVNSLYSDIALQLKEARLRQGISTKQLSHAVHIRERYIIALEEGKFELLPGIAYARGYIERIMEFLTVDSSEAIEMLNAIADEPSRKLFQLNMFWGESPHPTMFFVGVCSFLAFLTLCVWHYVSSTQPAAFISNF